MIPISPIISDIIKSVTSPGKALGLVFYLFLISVLIYVSFGMSNFKSDFVVNILFFLSIESLLLLVSYFYFLLSHSLHLTFSICLLLNANLSISTTLTLYIFLSLILLLSTSIHSFPSIHLYLFCLLLLSRSITLTYSPLSSILL